LQLATPYTNDDDIEGSLDTWIQKIKGHHKQDTVQWLSQSSQDGKPKKKEKKKSGSSSNTASATPAEPDVSKYNISALKQQLVEAGMPEDMIGLFSDADIVENARSMGLLEGNKEDEK